MTHHGDSGDIECVGCGYDLRGLPTRGDCPECGLAIAETLWPPPRLRSHRPQWRGRLTWAARCWLIGAAASPGPLIGLFGLTRGGGAAWWASILLFGPPLLMLAGGLLPQGATGRAGTDARLRASRRWMALTSPLPLAISVGMCFNLSSSTGTASLFWLPVLFAATAAAAGGMAFFERAVAEVHGGRKATPPRLLLAARGFFVLTPFVVQAASAPSTSAVEAVVIVLLPATLGGGMAGYLLTFASAATLVDLAAGRGDTLPRR